MYLNSFAKMQVQEKIYISFLQIRITVIYENKTLIEILYFSS
jgi:hypothetical protein